MTETELAPDEPAPADVEVEAEPAPAEEAPKDEPKEDPIQKRFDKLTREKYDARRKADLAEYENRSLKERLAALEAKPSEVATQEPTLEASGYDEAKYRAAMREWVRTEAISAAREEARKEVSGSRAERIHSEFEQRQADFVKSTPDYIEKVLERDTLPISSEIQDTLKQMENGPAIAYYLCNNEAKAVEIMNLPPLLQAREIGRIEASLEKKPATRVSNAPPPPARIESDNSANTTGIKPDTADSDKLSDAEWMRRRRNQVSKRR